MARPHLRPRHPCSALRPTARSSTSRRFSTQLSFLEMHEKVGQVRWTPVAISTHYSKLIRVEPGHAKLHDMTLFRFRLGGVGCSASPPINLLLVGIRRWLDKDGLLTGISAARSRAFRSAIAASQNRFHRHDPQNRQSLPSSVSASGGRVLMKIRSDQKKVEVFLGNL